MTINQEELIALAKEANFYTEGNGVFAESSYQDLSSRLAKFAELLAKRNAEPVAWRHKKYRAELYGSLADFAYDYGNTEQAEELFTRASLPAEQDAELLDILKAIRDTLHRENDNENGAIQDTIWHRPSETLFDYIDQAIAKRKDGE
jgi:hypothetical protein